MGLLDKINELKAKKIEEMSFGEVKSMLQLKPLDDIQLTAIQKKLDIDTSVLEGFDLKPQQIKGMSQRQHELRLAAGLWHVEDVIYDKENCMIYKTTFDGVHGVVSDNDLAKEPNKQITIPEKVLGKRVSSLESAFHNAKHLTVPPIIKAHGVKTSATTFTFSGLTKIPDIDKMLGYPDKTINNTIIKKLYDGLMTCTDLSLQECFDYVLKNYSGNPQKPCEFLANEIAYRAFDLPTQIPFIRKQDAARIQEQLKVLSKNGSRREKVTLLAQLRCKSISSQGNLGITLARQLCSQLKTSQEGAVVMYASGLKPEDVIMYKAMVAQEGNENGRPIYLMGTKDNIAVIYDPNKETFFVAGHTNDGGQNIELSRKFQGIEFEPIDDIEKSNILKEINLEYSEVASDVLENDNIETKSEQSENNSHETKNGEER